MSDNKVPAASQTVGPFWHQGLKWDQGNRAEFASGNPAITLFGQVFDGDGAVVTDAMIELFATDKDGAIPNTMSNIGRNDGYVRTPTDKEGIYRAHIAAPGKNGFLHVIVFARGLLTHVYTRVYIPQQGNDFASDGVLEAARKTGRAQTLFAEKLTGNAYRWDIRMQGEGETVFFARD
jgi:protocatechuate 3,4-dioxygenase, alpha subunit